jgi:uncharacterized protein involved in response to NO
MSTRRTPAFEPQPTAPAGRSARLLLAVPHRFFFFIGATQIVVISLWWGWVLAARAWPALPGPGAAVPATSLHALLMLCGFAPFFMFGSLFTAGPRWLAVTPPPSSAWRPPGILAALAALALVPLEVAGPAHGSQALHFAAGAYAIGWLWLAFLFYRLIRMSRADDKLHAILVLGAQLAGAHSLLVLAGSAGIPLGSMHALSIGFASSLLMAMVTRVTCGHSGRTLAADALTWRLFVLLQLTAVVRVAAGIAAGPVWLAVAGLMWIGAFVPWCAKYAPVYWRARADGRPG